MGVKQTAFASISERKNFYKLQRAWGDKYHIFHNIPFLNIFTTKDLVDISDPYNIQTIVLDPVDENRLKKTSVDYTLCDEKDCPLVCIDFDGMQQGYSVGTTYYPDKNIYHKSPWRREITELKLKVAHGSMFPYFVVGSKYFDDFPLEVNLTIVDGIIGDIIANKKASEEISTFSVSKMGMTEEEFAKLSKIDQDMQVEDYLLGVEVTAELENNPISKRVSQLRYELDITSWSSTPLSYPEIDANDKKWWMHTILHGYRVTYHTQDLGDIEGIAWLPNFNMPGFSSGSGLTENIACLYALERIKYLRSKNK